MNDTFSIYFERSGGFLGRTISITINSETLSETEKEKIADWIENFDLMNLQISESVARKTPDRFQYELCIDKGNRSNSMTIPESAVPDELKSLINYLTQKIREKK